MRLDPFWLHFAFVVLIVIGAYFWHMKTQRLQACYNLYQVRDALVLLVARGVLPEDSRVFKHYYERINILLAVAPKVGIDDMLEQIFNKVSPEEFDATLNAARRQAKQMEADPLMKHDDVRQVVADYYIAIRALILSHSSLLKAAYVVSRHLSHAAVARGGRPPMPSRIARGLDAVEYAEDEASAFRPAT